TTLFRSGLKTIVYRDRKSGNLLGGTQANYDDVNEIPPMSFPITSFGNYFISCHFPSQGNSLLSNSSILRNEDKQKIKNLTEEDKKRKITRLNSSHVKISNPDYCPLTNESIVAS